MLIRRKRKGKFFHAEEREYTEVLKIQEAKRRSVGLKHKMRENQFYAYHHYNENV